MAKKTHPLTLARAERKLNLQQAADILGVSVSTVWNWEHRIKGKEPNAESLRNIRKNFDISADDMLGIKPVVKD